MAVAGPPLSRFSFPTFPHRARKDGAPGYLAGVRLRDTRSLGCARDDRLFRVCTGGDARACADWRSLVQRSFVGSRVCATPLPQDDGGRLASPWAFSRVSASILGGDWPCPVSEMDGVRWSRFSFPTFPHRARKDGAPVYLAGVRLRDTKSLGCARDDRLFRVCTGGDARACADWRSLVQRSFVGSRVCATPLPQDDGGRLASPG